MGGASRVESYSPCTIAKKNSHPIPTLLFHCSYLFMWIQQLFLKTETLDFVEILTSLKGDNIVCADSCHWIICWVTGCVKCQSSFSRRNLKAVHDYLTKWLHLPTKNTDVIIMYGTESIFQNLTAPWLVKRYPAFYGPQ